MKELVDQLKRNRTLSPEELRLLLTDASPEEREYLHRAAREVARVHFGNGVFVRGLIEISNYCRNDCRYCGIRRSNRLAERYRLTPETVLACCEEGYRLSHLLTLLIIRAIVQLEQKKGVQREQKEQKS